MIILYSTISRPTEIIQKVKSPTVIAIQFAIKKYRPTTLIKPQTGFAKFYSMLGL